MEVFLACRILARTPNGASMVVMAAVGPIAASPASVGAGPGIPAARSTAASPAFCPISVPISTP